jgi:hypothetical protein
MPKKKSTKKKSGNLHEYSCVQAPKLKKTLIIVSTTNIEFKKFSRYSNPVLTKRNSII